MSRLTYKLNEQEQEEHKTKYLKFEYFPIPDYCIEKGNYGRITSDMIYNKLGKLEDLEEILKNGFIENDRYHRQIFLAYINNDWVICDNETNEKFSLNEVLKG